ncbi:MAG: hypothetical protein WAV54_06095, partial [Acidimicrobiales bacterium]
RGAEDPAAEMSLRRRRDAADDLLTAESERAVSRGFMFVDPTSLQRNGLFALNWGVARREVPG